MIAKPTETAGRKVRSQKFKTLMLQLKYSLSLPCLLSHPWQMTCCCWSDFTLSQRTTWVTVTQNTGKSAFFWQSNPSKMRYVSEISEAPICLTWLNKGLDTDVTASHKPLCFIRYFVTVICWGEISLFALQRVPDTSEAPLNLPLPFTKFETLEMGFLKVYGLYSGTSSWGSFHKCSSKTTFVFM